MPRAATVSAVDELGAVALEGGDDQAEGGDHVVALPDRDRDRAGAQAHLLLRGRVVVAEHQGQLAAQASGLGDGVGRDAVEVREDPALDVGRRVREQHLADARGVQRKT